MPKMRRISSEGSVPAATAAAAASLATPTPTATLALTTATAALTNASASVPATTTAAEDAVGMLTSPRRGGIQKEWTEDENILIGEAWLEVVNDENYSGLTISAVAAGVLQLLAARGGPVADKTQRQLEAWYRRMKKVHKRVVARLGMSGAKCPIAQEGETAGKRAVSHAMWTMLRSLFGDEIATAPPKPVLASSSGGVSEADLKAALAELKEASKKRPSSHTSDLSAQELLKEVNALKELKEIGFYDETEYKEKIQELKNKQKAGSGSSVDQRAKKKNKSAAASEKQSSSSEEEEDEEGE